MIQKSIRFFGEPYTIACDGRCDKAWGINGRPRHYFQSQEVAPDDYVYLPDSWLGTAPFPETYEGGYGRPCDGQNEDGNTMNKWCTRECERSKLSNPGDPVEIKDMEHPKPNVIARQVKA